MQVEKLDQSLGKYLKAQPIPFQNNGQHESMFRKNIRKCPSCNQAILALKQKQNNQGFYITCLGYPACKTTFWLPSTVIDAQVTDNVCSQVLNLIQIMIIFLMCKIFYLIHLICLVSWRYKIN